MRKIVQGTAIAAIAVSSLAILPTAANAADAKANSQQPGYTITTAKGSREITIALHDAKASKTDGGVEIYSVDGKDLGLLPNVIQQNGVKYTLSYKVTANGTVTADPVDATRAPQKGMMQPMWNWKCMAKTSEGGAVAGAITGAESGPGAVGTAFLGALGGAAASIWTC